ncbi:MAG: TIGR03085 family metal-binding protein [Corynebacterium sp.]|nr:TIGR03085 family metal-binding protein [Corynebacterium sp.]
MTLAQTYRHKLASALREAGPDAPTLCEGWRAADLAAHLYIRENKPLAAAGIFVSPLHKVFEKTEAEILAQPYEQTIAAWEKGPSKRNPMKYADQYMNGAEHFVHYADVARAQDPECELPLDAQQAKELHRATAFIAKRELAKAPVPVIAFPDGMPRIIIKDKKGVSLLGDDVVRLSGPIGEILLWAYGRPASGLTFSGPVEKLN